MRIVNPSGVKFTNKYLNWFRCLGLGDHGFGGAANEGKKAASNVALPGNSDHNFSKSPVGKKSVPFIGLMLRTTLKITVEKMPKRPNRPNIDMGNKVAPANQTNIKEHL